MDRVEYDGGPNWPDPTGASMELTDLTADNNDGSNWVTSPTDLGNGDFGTPGSEYVPEVIAEPANIVITEIMQNPDDVGDNDGEWFEIYNAGTETVDLEGWTISDLGTNSHVISNGGPT